MLENILASNERKDLIISKCFSVLETVVLPMNVARLREARYRGAAFI